MTSFNVTATAIAAHRPRDTTIVLDFSGSMNNESDLWNCESYQGSYEGTSNNTDPVYPQWGYYNTSQSPLCQLLCTANSDLVGYSNISQSVGGCAAQVNELLPERTRGQRGAGFCRRHHLAGRHQRAGRPSPPGLPGVRQPRPFVDPAQRRSG
jgi:hypothetical protein